jgi:hypothetical protein
MRDQIRLEFDNLPTFESTPFFFSLEDVTDRRLRTLPNTYARCNAALRFMSWIGAGAEVLHVRDEERDSMRVAYLRASLMEYVGMEEALRLDVGSGALNIPATRDAMLVVLRELRNVQIHLIGSALIAEKRPAISRYKGEEHTHELTALMIPRSDLNRLKDPRNASYCNRSDFHRAVDWLADAQERWGIADVVMRGIWRFAVAIVAMHVVAEDVASPEMAV